MEGVQMSLFDSQTDWLRIAMLRPTFAGGRVRAFAALSFPQWQDRAYIWLRDEYGGTTCAGGTIGEGDSRGFVEYRPDWIFIRPSGGNVLRFSWREAVRKVRELMEAGEYLTRDDEREIERIAAALGGSVLPYPRPRLRYPDFAWKDGESPYFDRKRSDT